MHPIHDLPDVCSCGEPWETCTCPPTPTGPPPREAFGGELEQYPWMLA